MLIKELPKRLHPEKLCHLNNKAVRYEAELKLGDLPNLPKELRAQKEVKVRVWLHFDLDDAGLACIQGEMAVDLEMTCQRCLKLMTVPMRALIKVSPVDDPNEDRILPAEYEPLLMHEGEIILVDWIAEELLLALPLVPRHDTPCVSSPEVAAEQEESELNNLQRALLKLKDMK